MLHFISIVAVVKHTKIATVLICGVKLQPHKIDMEFEILFIYYVTIISVLFVSLSIRFGILTEATQMIIEQI